MSPFDAAWLGATIRLSAPILMAATGELISERAGVINIGLEGMVLTGAFFSFLAADLSNSFVVGVLAGLLAGVLLAAVMGIVSIQARADQIVTGVGLNILALGITTFLNREIFSGRASFELPLPSPIEIPFLSKIPAIGATVFRQSPLVYVALLGVVVVWFALYRTGWGLGVRAAGELPAAADTAGRNVERIRWTCTLIAGGMAGVAGAYLSIGRVGFFTEGMSAGRGFIALAAVIFGGWRPAGVLLASLAFGGADALQLRLQAEPSVPGRVWLVIGLAFAVWAVAGSRRWPAKRPAWRSVGAGLIAGIAGVVLFTVAPQWHFPPQLWLALPYVFALGALSRSVRRAHMPSALAIPYVRGQQ